MNEWGTVISSIAITASILSSLFIVIFKVKVEQIAKKIAEADEYKITSIQDKIDDVVREIHLLRDDSARNKDIINTLNLKISNMAIENKYLSDRLSELSSLLKKGGPEGGGFGKVHRRD